MDCGARFTAEGKAQGEADKGVREERGGSGGDESCGTFFTADKNICWDINLEP